MTAAPKRSLRERVFKAGGITVAGYAASQLLRFGSNLILTRLLFPEAFGIVAIMQAVVIGVVMLSDVGVAQSIIRNKSGAEPRFINTAWTIQIGKGAVMALALLVAAPFVAKAYGQPMIGELMPMAALAALIGGFNSTKVALADRNVDAVRVTLMDVGTLTVGIVASIVIAWYHPSPWALVWGNLISTVTRMSASHLLLRGPSNRFAWDRDVARSIFSFGGWVLLSSVLTFLAGEGNKLVSAALLDVKLLALLGIATTLSMVVWQAVSQMTGRVLFPAYSEVLRTDKSRFSAVVEKARRVQIAPAWLVSLVFAVFGTAIVNFLYDARYEGAGVILQLLSLGLMVGMLNGSFGGALWALGKVGISTWMLVAQVAIQLTAMFVGHAVFGKGGVIMGFAASGWMLYPIHAAVYARLGLWHPRTDIPVLVLSTVAAVGVLMHLDWQVLAGWH
jgi:O-antigen/teichoic acid export membrane protein